MNISWLRGRLGFVQQEPVLLEGSVMENIRMGCGEKLGRFLERQHNIIDPIIHDFAVQHKDETNSTEAHPSLESLLPIQKIKQSAKLSNISKFIENQPETYSTQVGIKGSKLSGGQKQRIALARAFMRDSDIMLLDEATSALDNESEKYVNESINKVRKEDVKTVVIVAHRLSSIKFADVILAFDKGKLIEEGSHDDLVKKRGFYYDLVKNQL